MEQVSDLSDAPVEKLPPSPPDCPNCMTLRRLLGQVRTKMNQLELRLVETLKKLENNNDAPQADAPKREEEAPKQDS